MNLARVLVSILFSSSGIVVISFGTFSGLILAIETLFSTSISKTSYLSIYLWYLSFLFVAMLFGTYPIFDSGLKRGADSSLVETEQERIDRIARGIVRRQKIKVALLGGIPLLVDWILEKNKISFCDLFSRPRDWATYPEDHKEYPIFRLVKDGKSLEIRFPKKKPRYVLVRETLPESDLYGEFREELLWSWKVLFVITPFACFWHFVRLF